LGEAPEWPAGTARTRPAIGVVDPLAQSLHRPDQHLAGGSVAALARKRTRRRITAARTGGLRQWRVAGRAEHRLIAAAIVAAADVAPVATRSYPAPSLAPRGWGRVGEGGTLRP